MKYLSLFFCTVCTILVIEGAVLPSKGTCNYQGKTYQVGEHTNSNPCSPCTCYSGGSVMCLAIDCAPAMCVDVTHTKGQCCGTCPNGRNCKYHDVIIKAGDQYKPDAHTTCTCSTDPMHMYGAHRLEAVCVKSL